MSQPPADISKPWLFGHPKGLYVLFMTEMWERFSYYGMRALLVLYMTKFLFFTPEVARQVLGFEAIKGGLEFMFGPLGVQPLASQIYGLYTGFVYFTPFFGGLLADRLLGQRKTVVVGGILMAIGHFLMAIQSLFFLALFFLILGNGCFKPNISTQVGGLYPPGDSRRDGAFTIFYMGINLGAFFSPLVCGTLGQTVGWHYGFGAAGVGMVIGLIIYLWGQKYLATDNLTQHKQQHAAEEKLSAEDWMRILGLMLLCSLNIVFWGVYEQQGNTMQLWADANTDLHVLPFLNWEMPSTWYQSFNPFMIFIFAPLSIMLWSWQAKRGREPSSVIKMAIGCLLLGLAFVVMIFEAKVIGDHGKGSVWWLVWCTLILTIGELYLSPIGLSLVTKVSPAKMVSMMMGMWFLSSFFGNYLSGYLGTYWEKMPKESFFALMAAMSFGAGALFWLFSKWLKKALNEHGGPSESISAH